MPEKFVVPDVFSGYRVKAFFTTKTSGNDVRDIEKAAGISLNVTYLPIQNHSDNVVVLHRYAEPRRGDAVITNVKNIFIGVQVADCVPVLLYERKTKTVGAVHAGWRGTAGAILKKTIVKMTERFGCSPSDMLIAIGPAIRGRCYGVGHEVMEVVKKATGVGNYCTTGDGKYYLDLPIANRCQALSLGIPVENIWMSDECTFCLPERYYSYRYSKETTGRQYGLIGML